jgi:hypothetical protein
VIHNVLLPGGLGHRNGDLVKLPDFALLPTGKPLGGRYAVFAPPGFGVGTDLQDVITLPSIPILPHNCRRACSRSLNYLVSVGNIPIIFTVFDRRSLIVLPKVFSTGYVLFPPVNP